MTLLFGIDVLALLVGSVYCTIPLFWLVVHPFIHRWRRRGRRAYALILPIWALLIATAFLLAWPFRFAHLYRNWAAWVPAVLLFCEGFFLYLQASRSFHHTQVSGLSELEPQRHHQELVTTGIHGWVRHPIYLAHLCEVLGWCVGTGLLPLYALLIFAALTGAFMIHFEDRELEARFGDTYRSYRHAVPAIVPRFGRLAQ